MEATIIILLLSLLSGQVVILFILGWGVNEYIRLRQHAKQVYSSHKRYISFIHRAMNLDDLLDQHLETSEEETTLSKPSQNGSSGRSSPESGLHEKQRTRLAALASGGQAKQYLGKTLTADQVDAMEDEEIEKLYARYEARLGATMTKTLGQAALQLYVGLASRFLPIPTGNLPNLVADLEADPFVGHALSSASCELYHRYGMYLAPLTAALTTARHCRIEYDKPCTDSEDVGGCNTVGPGGESDDSGKGVTSC